MAADEGSRKLTAILAADVAGYSRLMVDDERATVRTLTEYRTIFTEKVEAHEGRIVDTTGDSVMATFESVVEAVEAAVDVQRDLAERNETLSGHRKMHFRIGVNLGDIIVRNDGTIYGDGVNVAARLEGLAEPGGVMIGDFARLGVEGKLGVGLEDAGEHEVKNIEKPVRAWRVLVDGAEASSAKLGSPSKPLRRPKVIASLAAALAVVIGLAVWGVTVRVEVPQMVTADGTPTDDPMLAMPSGPAIAVLPFDNLGQEETERIFAEGLAAEIANALSNFDLRVTAHGSASQYSGGELARPDIAEALKVRYLLTGGVAKSEERLRVQAQLFDAESDTLMWGETYERDLTVAHLFDVQDDVTLSVVAAIAGDLGAINKLLYREAKRGLPGSTDAYACVLMFHDYSLTLSLEASTATRSCLETTVESEPDYADAWAALGELYVDAAVFGYGPYDEDMEKGEEAVRRALVSVRGLYESDESVIRRPLLKS